MNLNHSLIFAYLEEDNTQRAFFRVRPLLTPEGDLRQDAQQLWPNEGALRIVPDRNEQHIFKVRMRKLLPFCVVDLRNQPAEVEKIRTNKNFNPDHGELNQYIVYSDTVRPLPEHTFYQLLEGAADRYQELAQEAITPLFYIKQGETLYGPVRKASPSQPDTAAQAACVLFEIPCPDGVERQILCMDDAPAVEKPEEEKPAAEKQRSAPVRTERNPRPAADARTEDLPIGQPLQILDQSSTHDETLRQLDKPVSENANLLRQREQPMHVEVAQHKGPLSGTPLVRKPLHVPPQQPKNRVQEIVTNQWAVGSYVAPARDLPAGAAMRNVENPVEAACASLRKAWKSENAHEQLLDFMLSLDGVRRPLEAKLCNVESDSPLQQLLQQRLQDLESERLTALCELDRARRDLDAYKQELCTAMASRLARETGELKANREDAASQLEQLTAQVGALTLQRDELLARVNELNSSELPEAVARITSETGMCLPIDGVPLRLHPVTGNAAGLEEMICRLTKACAASGLRLERNAAIASLLLLAICPRIGVTSPTLAAASTLMKNLAGAMGWQDSFALQYSVEQHPVVGSRPVDSTPAMIATCLPHYAVQKGVTKVLLHHNAADMSSIVAYTMAQWPIVSLPELPFVAEMDCSGITPISADAVARLAEQAAVTDAELDAALETVLGCALPLSGAARKEMYRFISVCAGLMEGGLPVAADWGLLLWIIPAVAKGSKAAESLKAKLAEYPLSFRML